MVMWRDANTEQERAAAIKAALRECGTVTAAAKALGLSRRHLSRLLGRETRCLTGTRETPTYSAPLTYGRAVPKLVNVNGAAAEIEDDVVVMTLPLPRRLVEWLELEAVRRKHAAGASKAAKGPIIAEMIEREIKAEGKKR